MVETRELSSLRVLHSSFFAGARGGTATSLGTESLGGREVESSARLVLADERRRVVASECTAVEVVAVDAVLRVSTSILLLPMREGADFLTSTDVLDEEPLVAAEDTAAAFEWGALLTLAVLILVVVVVAVDDVLLLLGEVSVNLAAAFMALASFCFCSTFAATLGLFKEGECVEFSFSVVGLDEALLLLFDIKYSSTVVGWEGFVSVAVLLTSEE